MIAPKFCPLSNNHALFLSIIFFIHFYVFWFWFVCCEWAFTTIKIFISDGLFLTQKVPLEILNFLTKFIEGKIYVQNFQKNDGSYIWSIIPSESSQFWWIIPMEWGSVGNQNFPKHKTTTVAVWITWFFRVLLPG